MASTRRLVYVSISGYGQDGPYRDRAGHDLSYEGVGGLLADQADAGQPGPCSGGPLADVGAALFAAIAILSAVVSSQRTGQGRYVDVSMSDAVVSMLTAFLFRPPMAHRWASSLPSRAMACSPARTASS